MAAAMAKRVDTDRALAEFLLDVVQTWDNTRPRSLQLTLGPSELGGCREYIRAVVANDPGLPETGFKAAAFMGTAVGDLIERVFGESLQAITQFEITTFLSRSGITVAGSSDAIIPAGVLEIAPDGLIIDVKSKDGIATPEKYGASLENMIQLATYLVGAVQMGVLTADAKACLLYADRGGNDKRFATVTIDHDEALRWVDLAEDRLQDVQDVLDRGSQEEDRWRLRDKDPNQWCFAVQCPFRENCWGGSDFRPTAEITHPDVIEQVNRYKEAMAEEKAVASRKADARKGLVGVTGIAPDRTTVTWTRTGRTTPDGEDLLRLDVRSPR